MSEPLSSPDAPPAGAELRPPGLPQLPARKLEARAGAEAGAIALSPVAGMLTGPSPSAPLPPLHSSVSRLHLLEALVAISQELNAATDPHRVGEVLAERTAELLDVPAVLVQTVNDHDWVKMVASGGISPKFAQLLSGPRSETIAGRAMEERRTFAAWDLRRSGDPTLARIAKQEDVVAVACTPMLVAGQAVGALTIFCREMRRFTSDEFYALSLLASQGGVALVNADSYHTLRTQSEAIRAGFERVGEALSASLDLGETLHLILQLSIEMSRADAGAVYMLEDAYHGGGMRLAGMRGLDRRSARRFRAGAISPLARRALTEKRIVVVPEARRLLDMAFPTLRLADDRVAEVRSVVCVPLLSGDRALGVLEHYSSEVGAFEQNEVNLLATFTHQATVAIERAHLYAEECHLAETLQRAFLPELPQTVRGFQIGRIYAPGNAVVSVGGDTYDIFPLPDGRLAIVIADVTGNGIGAATLAVMAKYTARAYALENPDPASVLNRLNDAINAQTDDATFVTVIYALVEPDSGRISIANAGHPPALYYRASERSCASACGEPGVMAGFLPGQEYRARSLRTSSGDILVFYTDGVTEARRGKDQFDMERLIRVVRENSSLSAQEIAAAIYGAVTDYVAGERADDIALLVLKAE